MGKEFRDQTYFRLLISVSSLATNGFTVSSKQRLGTPFENPQRWMGQNTFPILLLNDDKMIGEH